ncbi:MAG: polysaccharide deacetylase family protein [Pseudonocardiaceae bacterium]
MVSAAPSQVGVDVHEAIRLPYRYWGTGLILALVVLASLVMLKPYRSASLPRSPEPVPAAGPAQSPPGGAVTLPAPPVPADLIRHTARADRVVALTFDDGPTPEYTPQVLALLTRYHAVATFCMIGSEAVRHPELVRRVVAAGMRLCSHTVTHDPYLIYRPEPQIEDEIVGGRADIRAAAGSPVAVDYFRAPAGRWSPSVRYHAARNGMKPLSWSVDPRDWSRPGVAQLITTVQQQVQPGAVILMHDGGGCRDQTVAALAELLPWLVAQGYQFDVPGDP